MVPVDITLGASGADNTRTSKDSFNVEMHEVNEGGKPKEFEITISQNDDASPQVELASGDNDHDGDVGGMEQKADLKKPKKIKVKFIMPEEVKDHANNNWAAAVDMFYKYWIDQVIRVIKEDLENKGILDENFLKDFINKPEEYWDKAKKDWADKSKNKDLINKADEETKKDLKNSSINSPDQAKPTNSAENGSSKKKALLRGLNQFRN